VKKFQGTYVRVFASHVLFLLTAMARVRQMSTDSVPFPPDQAVSPISTQLQVSTTQVKLVLYLSLQEYFALCCYTVNQVF
jgi:hypothetical protein